MTGGLRHLPNSSGYRDSPDFKADFESSAFLITTSFCFDDNVLSISSCSSYNYRELYCLQGLFSSIYHSFHEPRAAGSS